MQNKTLQAREHTSNLTQMRDLEIKFERIESSKSFGVNQQKTKRVFMKIQSLDFGHNITVELLGLSSVSLSL